MIRVNIEHHGDKRECSLRLEGHAGYREIGQDIVCASATILAYTMAQVVKAMDIDNTIELQSGDATIKCRVRDDTIFSELECKFSVIETGYALLAHNYPQYVELNIVGKDE